ncbi:hypothetical protein D8821_07785 [Streptococcus gordonii]|nr:hypothetical protein D8822_10105 [Streptococcus gordonii]RSJ33763.1 hypothetical protein D8821_07785 [Streptococcus gordonii]
MTNILLLLKVQLYSTFSLNDLRKGRGLGRYFKLGLLFLLVLLFSGYNLLTALSLVKLGQANLIPAYMIALVSFIIFFFSLMQSNGILFDQEELDRLIVLPLSIREIVYEKYAFLYLLNSVFAILLMLPAGLVWFRYGASLLELLFYLLLMGFVPLLPLCLASLLGLCVAYIASKAPHKNLVAFLFSLLLLLGMATGSMWAMRAGLSGENVGLVLTKQLTSLYPPASLFFNLQHFLWASLLLMFASFVLTGLFLRYLSRNYLKMNQMITGVKSESKVYRSWQKSPFMALYRREVANFVSSYLYMLNSGLGTILIIVLAILLCFMSSDVLFSSIGLSDSREFLPLLLAGCLSISNPAAVSISLEGEEIWLLQTLPVSMRQIMMAKLALTVSLHFVALLLGLPVLAWRFSLGVLQVVDLVLISLAYSLFTALQGLVVNFHFPKFIWDNEMIVIKQSFSTILSGGIGILVLVFPLCLSLLFGMDLEISLRISALGLLLLAVVLYRHLIKQGYFKEVHG